MAALDPTQRFSSRVEDYAKYRPSYPQEIVPLLAGECGLAAGATIADIGSGTGLLSRLFLESGYQVVGIEPNADMRRAGEAFLASYKGFTSLDGRAERTGLADASVDLISAGQAFHWFNSVETRQEFSRILRPHRWVALVWNEREVTGDFLEGYEALLHRYSPDYAKVDHRRFDAGRMGQFFGHDGWKLSTFRNVQEFDLEGVRGRLQSSSYAPQPGDPAYEPMLEELDRLFAAHAVNGRVEFLYRTNLYYGAL